MTYQMMNPTSCELINLECVDEWLENDLIESGIILADEKEPAAAASMTPAQVLMASPPTSNCTPIMTPLIEDSTPLLNYKPVSPIETPKITPQEMPKNSIDLEPFIKALVLLGSLQNPQQQKQKLDNDHDQLNKGVKRERTEDMTKEEIIALKRQRNTDAARRSRLRKSLKMESLEKQVAELEMENEKLKLHLAVSESERVNVEAKEKQSTLRVMELERQLVDAHSVLLRHTTTALKV